MARGRARPRGFIRPAPKTKIWIQAGLVVQTLGSGAATLIGTLNAAALAARPFTILRTRIELMFRSDQSATNESPTGAYGEIVVKETASAIGVTAVPSPLTEGDADWHVYQAMSLALLSLTSVGVESPIGVRYVIDSRAMRKVGPTDDLVNVAELRSAGGAFLNIEGRILIQLH